MKKEIEVIKLTGKYSHNINAEIMEITLNSLLGKTIKEKFNIDIKDYEKVVKLIKDNSKIKLIYTRAENDMEQKYILILANGDIVKTEHSKDKIVGNALNDDKKNFMI